eukprot:1142210-Pelagomonas_calceolata.AAC.1
MDSQRSCEAHSFSFSSTVIPQILKSVILRAGPPPLLVSLANTGFATSAPWTSAPEEGTELPSYASGPVRNGGCNAHAT